MKKKALVIDDSMYMRMLIIENLKKLGFEVVGEASNGEDGIEKALEFSPDLITLDNVLPDMFGREILRVFKEEGLKAHVIMISAVGQDSVIDEELSMGAVEYIVKPFKEEQLAKAVEKVLQKKVTHST